MPLTRRHLLTLPALVLPAGCAVQALPPLATQPVGWPAGVPPVRPPATGQQWRYRIRDRFNSAVLGEELDTVASSGAAGTVVQRRASDGSTLPDERLAAWGQVLQEPVWDHVHRYEAAVPHWPASLAPGASQSVVTRYRSGDFSFLFWITVHTRVVAHERVQVPAGGFDTVRVEKLIKLQHYEDIRADYVRQDRLWLAPETGRWVARESSGQYQILSDASAPGKDAYLRWELLDWK